MHKIAIKDRSSNLYRFIKKQVYVRRRKADVTANGLDVPPAGPPGGLAAESERKIDFLSILGFQPMLVSDP
jgi:hypothetical protein